ncbi:hypothetical protein GCM10007390_20360 [Persicitalea jodogahamensis]|uniref:Right handed beta helix domain-containing protein n=1 Tax=Persicitalea jodogahamensis TaxID=402147 RepID=A0A8J3D890_9BACT|nr:hypothetical protein GCM10007390_20360 [Persicitalea jodogahamensis]
MVIEFPNASRLQIDGVLLAQGTATDSIYFRGVSTSYFTFGGGILLYYLSTSVLDYVSMDRMGLPVPFSSTPELASIYVGSACTIKNSTVSNSTVTGIFIQEDGDGYNLPHFINDVHIQNNRFLGNSIDVSVSPNGWGEISEVSRLTIRMGKILKNSTWPSRGPNAYYEIFGNIEIPQGIILTIEPGVSIESQSDEVASLRVYGTLLARGTATDSIHFRGATRLSTRYSNFRSSWRIFIDSGNTASMLEYISVDQMGFPDPNPHFDPGNAAIYIGGACTFKNSTVRNSIQTGIHATAPTVSFSNLNVSNSTGLGFVYDYEGDGSPVITTSNFVNNKKGGIQIYHGHPTFSNCGIYGNTDFGINNISNVATDTVDARNCYWGTPTGPNHPTLNPSGTGNRVSDKVLFNPWSQTPGNCLPVTIKAGNWNDPTVWLCGQVPGSTDLVVIRHVVALPGNFTAHAKQVAYEVGGRLTMEANSHIQIGN